MTCQPNVNVTDQNTTLYKMKHLFPPVAVGQMLLVGTMLFTYTSINSRMVRNVSHSKKPSTKFTMIYF